MGKYKFVKENKKLRAHIKRHLHSSKIPGSKFKKSAFSSVKQLINFAYKQIKGYKGQSKTFTIKFDKIIGEDAIIPLNKIKKGTKIKRIKREKNNYPINIIKGIEKMPTKEMVIIVGPLPNNKHSIFTIFPGKCHPPFPQTKKQLIKQDYKGKELEKQISKNKKLLKKWNKLVFIE